jgi:hypothetical protein
VATPGILCQPQESEVLLFEPMCSLTSNVQILFVPQHLNITISFCFNEFTSRIYQHLLYLPHY